MNDDEPCSPKQDCGVCNWSQGYDACQEDYFIFYLFGNKFCESCEKEQFSAFHDGWFHEFKENVKHWDCIPVMATGWADRPWPMTFKAFKELVAMHPNAPPNHFVIVDHLLICHNCGSRDHMTYECVKPCKNPKLMEVVIGILASAEFA
jgi:hypothetical protein